MRIQYLLIFMVFFWSGCETLEESVSTDQRLGLVFSSDSVSFDTLLSDSRSSTRRLSVYNPHESAIRISTISLGSGPSSDYQIVINGKKQSTVTDETLLGGDSLLILVEVNVNPRNNNAPYLVKDSIVFSWNGNQQDIKLVAYGQDGNRLKNVILCDEIWTRDRPYVLSDTLVVESGCTLTIESGARIYFENDAALFIQGTLKALGQVDAIIEFSNARFDGIYGEVPGQWNGIYFLEGSSNNEVKYCHIYNGQIGLRVGTPDEDDEADIQVSGCRIFNMSFAGILAFTSDIVASNTLIYNCGTYLVGNFAGGNYDYVHCTFSNEPSLFVQDQPSVQFSDNVISGDNEFSAPLNLNITNSIIWGAGEEEFLINDGGKAPINSRLENNIIRSGSEIENNFTSQEFNFPGFKNPIFQDYSLDTLAFAKDKGKDAGILLDILANPRDASPDIGAFERIEK